MKNLNQTVTYIRVRIGIVKIHWATLVDGELTPLCGNASRNNPWSGKGGDLLPVERAEPGAEVTCKRCMRAKQRRLEELGEDQVIEE